jgi:hypothetical protein
LTKVLLSQDSPPFVDLTCDDWDSLGALLPFIAGVRGGRLARGFGGSPTELPLTERDSVTESFKSKCDDEGRELDIVEPTTEVSHSLLTLGEKTIDEDVEFLEL